MSPSPEGHRSAVCPTMDAQAAQPSDEDPLGAPWRRVSSAQPLCSSLQFQPLQQPATPVHVPPGQQTPCPTSSFRATGVSREERQVIEGPTSRGSPSLRGHSSPVPVAQGLMAAVTYSVQLFCLQQPRTSHCLLARAGSLPQCSRSAQMVFSWSVCGDAGLGDTEPRDGQREGRASLTFLHLGPGPPIPHAGQWVPRSCWSPLQGESHALRWLIGPGCRGRSPHCRPVTRLGVWQR